jgi:aminoglycoside phosphotransferase
MEFTAETLVPLRRGCRARLDGLNARKDLNGQAVDVGVCEGERWVVTTDSGETVKARAANLVMTGGWPASSSFLAEWVVTRAAEDAATVVRMPEDLDELEEMVADAEDEEEEPVEGEGIEARWQRRQDMLSELRMCSQRYGLEAVTVLELGRVYTSPLAVLAAHVELVCCSCARLVELNLDSCSCMTDALFGRIAALRHLHSLSVRDCTAITDVGIARLAAGIPKGREDEPSPRERLRKSHGLMASLAVAMGADKPGFPSLRSLCLDGCTRVTDEGIGRLAQWCSSLEMISIIGCGAITDRSICALARNGALCGVRMAHCTAAATDTAICAIARACPRLHELNAAGAIQVSDFGIRAIAEYTATNLTELDLSGCRIGDVAIRALGACRGLKQLKIAGCSKLTHDAIAELASLNRALAIDVKGGSQLATQDAPPLQHDGSPTQVNEHVNEDGEEANSGGVVPHCNSAADSHEPTSVPVQETHEQNIASGYDAAGKAKRRWWSRAKT